MAPFRASEIGVSTPLYLSIRSGGSLKETRFGQQGQLGVNVCAPKPLCFDSSLFVVMEVLRVVVFEGFRDRLYSREVLGTRWSLPTA